MISSAPTALRLEALIRGFNDPAPLARRLVRLLQRTPRIVRKLLAAPAQHIAALPGYHAVIQAIRLARDAFAATPAPNSS